MATGGGESLDSHGVTVSLPQEPTSKEDKDDDKEKTETAAQPESEDKERNIKWNVTCGVTEPPKSDTVTISYKVPDGDHISWDWIEQTDQDPTSHVAKMIAWDSQRGHKSSPVPDTTFKKLGKPHISREGRYFKVQMSRKDNVSIEEYF